MRNPPDDQSDEEVEALMLYDEYIDESIGLHLKKRPSEGQKKSIIDSIVNSDKEDFDIDAIFQQHAYNCFEPLYLTDPSHFSDVASILSAFLPSSHSYSREMELNDEDPPLHIGQLLKKPSVEQLGKVVKAIKADDPKWISGGSDFDPSHARKLVLVLGNNFPELIKQNSRTRIIFENQFQDSANSSSPPLAKAKKEKAPRAKKKQKSQGCLKMVLLLLVILTVMIYLFN